MRPFTKLSPDAKFLTNSAKWDGGHFSVYFLTVASMKSWQDYLEPLLKSKYFSPDVLHITRGKHSQSCKPNPGHHH